jgi:hypothetical protein
MRASLEWILQRQAQARAVERESQARARADAELRAKVEELRALVATVCSTIAREPGRHFQREKVPAGGASGQRVRNRSGSG